MINPILSFRISIRLIQRFSMRFIVAVKPLREVVSRCVIAYKKPKALNVSKTDVFSSFNGIRHKKELREKGYTKGATVSQDYVRAILDFCQSTNATLGFKDRSKVEKEEVYIPVNAVEAPFKGISYYYYYDVHNRCKAVRDVILNTDLVSVVRDYLGAEPTLLFSNIIWTFPVYNKGQRVDEVGQFGFHFDIPDFKAVAVFVYLNDVDEDCGPHVVIGGTHKRKPLQALVMNTLSRNKASKKYANRVEVFTGTSGTMVIEDIYAYHKATNPYKPRLALKFFFGVQRETMVHNRNLRDFKKEKSSPQPQLQEA